MYDMVGLPWPKPLFFIPNNICLIPSSDFLLTKRRVKFFVGGDDDDDEAAGVVEDAIRSAAAATRFDAPVEGLQSLLVNDNKAGFVDEGGRWKARAAALVRNNDDEMENGNRIQPPFSFTLLCLCVCGDSKVD